MENKYKLMSKALFEQENLKYKDLDENVMVIPFELDNIKDLQIILTFEDADDSKPMVRTLLPVSFPDEKIPYAFQVVNILNARFRWTKFYLDDDYDIVAHIDTILSETAADQEILELVERMASIMDEAYPEMMKARYI